MQYGLYCVNFLYHFKQHIVLFLIIANRSYSLNLIYCNNYIKNTNNKQSTVIKTTKSLKIKSKYFEELVMKYLK